MSVYVNGTAGAPITSVEFQTVGGSTHAFYRLSPGTDSVAIASQLSGEPLHQQILSQPGRGSPDLIVARSDASPQTILHALAANGTALTPLAPPPKKFNPWAWRGYTSILGQSLQIASSIKGNGTAADRVAVFGFAALNLTANFINVIFGGQEKDDPHQLRFLKNQFNEQLAPHVDKINLPDVETEQLKNFPADEDKRSAGEKAHSFLKKYSVTFGEIFLRTLGSVSLAFPVTRWKTGLQTLRETGSLGKSFETIRNPNNVTFGVGLLMLLGKFTSFTSKEPDPYNPKPQSTLDVFREKIAFRLSSIIEGGAATWMAHDRFANQKISIGGKQVPDYYGGYGNVVFVGGYGVRLFAPYGTREVNMPELYAHIAQGLAHAAPDKLPALLSESAVKLQAHFAAKPQTVGDYYQALATELQKHHGIQVAAPVPAAAPTHVSAMRGDHPGTALAGERSHHQRIVSPQLDAPALA